MIELREHMTQPPHHDLGDAPIEERYREVMRTPQSQRGIGGVWEPIKALLSGAVFLLTVLAVEVPWARGPLRGRFERG